MLPTEADYTEGLRLFYSQRYDEALVLLTRAAEAGEPKSQHFLAMMYENGNGVARDYAKAAHWYGKCAAQGDGAAQLTYAMLLALGKGVETDIPGACHYATLSYHQGNANALQALRVIRAQAAKEATEAAEAARAAQDAGDGAEAERQLRRAAECGSADAQFALACLLLSEESAEGNRRAAAIWLREAAQQGHAEAERRLAELMSSAEQTLAGVAHNSKAHDEARNHGARDVEARAGEDAVI